MKICSVLVQQGVRVLEETDGYRLGHLGLRSDSAVHDAVGVLSFNRFVGRRFRIGTTGRAVRSVVLLAQVDSFSIRRPGSACHPLTG
jgi:hypothetical protein